MKYNSIGEYFYRLSNRCLALMLLPVLAVWAAYLTNQYLLTGLPLFGMEKSSVLMSLIVEGVIFGLMFWLQQRITSNHLARLQREPGLGMRINGYVYIVMVRFRVFSLMLLITGLSVFLTGELSYLYTLPIPVMMFLIYWPFRSRVSQDLKLKVEERDILKNKTMGV